MTVSIVLQFVVVLAAIWLGSRFSGVGLGLLTFLLLGLSSSGGMGAASRSLLFAAPEIAVWSYAFLFAVPLAATLICLITARVTLMRRLGVVT